jgi:hypothetical protein
MKAQRGIQVQLYSFFNRSVDEDGKRHVSAALPPGKRPGTPCIGGWAGPRVKLEVMYLNSQNILKKINRNVNIL